MQYECGAGLHGHGHGASFLLRMVPMVDRWNQDFHVRAVMACDTHVTRLCVPLVGKGHQHMLPNQMMHVSGVMCLIAAQPAS